MRTKMSEALAHLQQLVELGAEFPDAVYSTSVAFELDSEAVEMLEACYDYECTSTEYNEQY
jgi:hypothetical protein